MKISVITVCFNAEQHIERALKTVGTQTHKDLEFIVIDGASADGTMDIVERYRSLAAKIVSEKDGGIYDAMNKGIRAATGEAIYFLNADDYFLTRHAVELMARFLEDRPEVDVAYGGIEIRFPDGHTQMYLPPPENEALDFLIEGSLPHQATFARRRTFAMTGLFDTRYRSHADYDWFLKVAMHPGIRMVRAPVYVASFGLGGASSQLERGERERHAIQNIAPLYQSPEWMRRRIEVYQEIYLRQRLQLEARG